MPSTRCGPSGNQSESSRHTRVARRARSRTGRASARSTCAAARPAAAASRPNEGASASAIARTRSARPSSASSSGTHSRRRWTRLPKSRPAGAGRGRRGRGRGSRREAGGGDGRVRPLRGAGHELLPLRLPARGHRVAALGARERPQLAAAPGHLGRGDRLRVDHAHVGVRRRGQAVDELLPEAAHVGVDRRPGDDEQVARARAGHVQQPPRLRPRLLLLPPHERVPVRRLAAARGSRSRSGPRPTAARSSIGE